MPETNIKITLIPNGPAKIACRRLDGRKGRPGCSLSLWSVEDQAVL
jgi:hypothetical protein